MDEVILVDDGRGTIRWPRPRRLGLRRAARPNRGYGGNQKTCLPRRCAGGRRGGDAAPGLSVHAQAAAAMASLIAVDEFDVVLGSRILGGGAAGGMPVYKYVANRTLTATREPGTGPEALGVPHRLPGVLAGGADVAAARGEQRRLRVRRADAGAMSTLLGSASAR